MKLTFFKALFLTLTFLFISCSEKDNPPMGTLDEFQKAISSSGIGDNYSIPHETFQDFLNEIKFNENRLSAIGYKSLRQFLNEDDLDKFRDELREFIVKRYDNLNTPSRDATCDSSINDCVQELDSDCYC